MRWTEGGARRIEFGVLNKQCLDRRIGDLDTLRTEVEAWQSRRNDDGATM